MIITEDRDNFWMLNWLDQFMIGHKGFIAGGCFKNIFNKEKVKDLDIFFESLKDWEDAVEYFDTMTTGYEGEDKRTEEYSFYYQNENVKAYKHIKTGVVLELTCKVFGTPEEVLNKFDFTITKFAYYKAEVEDETGAEVEEAIDPDLSAILQETHIEYRIKMDDKFFEHLHLKRLVTDSQILYPASTFNRVLKYAKYGYFPCRETKKKIMLAINQLDKLAIEIPESMYDRLD